MIKKKVGLLIASGAIALSVLAACGSGGDFEEQYPADEPIMEQETNTID